MTRSLGPSLPPPLVERLALRQASGSVLDALVHPRAEAVR